VIPGLGFKTDEAGHGLAIYGVGRRRWVRVYRVDALWEHQRVQRRWLRVRHRYVPRHRIYYEDNPDLFEGYCEEQGSKEPGRPIHEDKHGSYCVAPARHAARFQVLSEAPKPRLASPPQGCGAYQPGRLARLALFSRSCD
jgi:hypothetical protein